MRVIATADLHYEREESRQETLRLAGDMLGRGADALMILGDTFAFDALCLEECLSLFSAFSGLKLICAGNHDLWTNDCTWGARRIMEERMAPVAARFGFHLLDLGPLFVGDVGFVGGCGWYDYQFREERLGVPLAFYRLKMGPGAVHRMDPGHVMDLPWSEIEERHFGIGAVWMDGFRVRWGADDQTVAAGCVERLRADLAKAPSGCRAVVCGTHHIPFEQMVTRKTSPDWAFGNAFMGSPDFGRALLENGLVKAAVFGHSHQPGRAVIGGVEAVNVGSTYRAKRFVELDV